MKEVMNGKSRIYLITATAVMTAVTCILAPMSIPIGPVPITLTNLVIYLSLYLLGWKMGTISVIIYLLIGMAGVPVFSGFSGGLAKLLGPTGGYIIGFIPMVIVAGFVIEKYNNRVVQFGAMVLGTAVCYILGTAWFCITTKTAINAALSLCVFPFIPVDIAKMILVLLIGPVIRRRLKEAGF